MLSVSERIEDIRAIMEAAQAVNDPVSRAKLRSVAAKAFDEAFTPTVAPMDTQMGALNRPANTVQGWLPMDPAPTAPATVTRRSKRERGVPGERVEDFILELFEANPGKTFTAPSVQKQLGMEYRPCGTISSAMSRMTKEGILEVVGRKKIGRRKRHFVWGLKCNQ